MIKTEFVTSYNFWLKLKTKKMFMKLDILC